MHDWDRREIFEFFSAASNPFYMASFNIDVTELYNFCHRSRLSFYYSLTFLCTKAMNSVENFRYVVKDGEVYLCPQRTPSCTDIPAGSTLFHILTLELGEDIADFCARAKAMNESQKCFIDFSKECGELVYVSCLPKLELTALTNEMNLADPKHNDDSVPRISWGRYRSENGRKTLTLALEVNHRFIDGIHLGMFAERLEELLLRPEQFLLSK